MLINTSDGTPMVRAPLLTLPYGLCNARPLLVPGKFAQATHSHRVLGNQRSKADALSSLANPEVHSASYPYFLYQTRLAKIPGTGALRLAAYLSPHG